MSNRMIPSSQISEILEGYIGEIFVDASFWIALMNVRDERYNHARYTWEAIIGRGLQPVTTNWTLFEALTLLNGRVVAKHDWALNLLDLVQHTTSIENAAAFEDRAVEVFISHFDRHWSIVDCANFVCINQRNCGISLAYDSDFCQAQVEFGFIRLPICG
ncbi:MAG: hypothetical protein OXI16_03225 [Chloroflexota bacterium]|nr:hypothetical protein [Chloroflexota bacterium]